MSTREVPCRTSAETERDTPRQVRLSTSDRTPERTHRVGERVDKTLERVNRELQGRHRRGVTPACWLESLELPVGKSFFFSRVPRSFGKEQINDLSQFVTGSSRIQLLHDAVEIGMKARDGGGCPHTSRARRPQTLGSKTAAGKRRGASHRWKRTHKGRRAQRESTECARNPTGQKLTMTGMDPTKAYGHTAQGASTSQINAMSHFFYGDSVERNPTLFDLHGGLVLRRVPRTAPQSRARQ